MGLTKMGRVSRRLIGKRFTANSTTRDPFGKIPSHKDESCQLCGGADRTIVAEIDRENVLCHTAVCDGCGLVFNNTQIKDLESYYKSEWAVNRWVDPEQSFLSRTSVDSFAYRRFCFLISELPQFFKKHRNVLEIGCGDGCNLVPFHRTGHSVLGFDFDSKFLQPGIDAGMELLNLDRIGDFDGQKFDLILVVHVFEHVSKLKEFIHKIRGFCHEETIIYVEVPGLRGFNQPLSTSENIMGVQPSNNFLGYIQLQHNFHFDLAHVLPIWQRGGFRKVYGDEFVRLILKPGFEEFEIPKGKNETLEFLAALEADRNSVRNLFARGLRFLSRLVSSGR